MATVEIGSASNCPTESYDSGTVAARGNAQPGRRRWRGANSCALAAQPRRYPAPGSVPQTRRSGAGSDTLDQVISWPAIAASNNAEWSDAVCRTHGIEAEVDDYAWTSRTRTPPLYPDAVTLVPDPSLPELLARIDSSPGCSIKDSFASLDLAVYGFRVLFDAQWIVRAPTEPQAIAASPRWTVVRNVDVFATWENVWRAGDGPLDVLRADLLYTEAVTVLAAQVDDRIVGGAVLNRSAAVVGISNFFAEDPITSESWQGCLALASALFPGATLMGYESGDTLDAVRTRGTGFAATSPRMTR